MAFLDDDNEWAPDYLERQLRLAASRAGADVVYCRALRRISPVADGQDRA